MPLSGDSKMTDAEIVTAFTNQIPTSSQAEAETGTEVNRRQFSPERIAQAIAALGGSGGSLSKVKNSNLLVIPTTFQDDTELNFEAEANKSYSFILMILGSYTGGNGIYMSVSSPTGATCKIGGGNWSSFVQIPTYSLPEIPVPLHNNERMIIFPCYICISETAGLVSIQWRQAISGAGSTIHKGTGLFVIGGN